MSVNIRIKHSSVQGKAPLSSDLNAGELALNTNENSPAAYLKDSAGNVVKLAGAGSVTGDEAVKKNEAASQNMTGALTLGTDKITLNADGSSVFLDKMKVSERVLCGSGQGTGGGAGEAAYLQAIGDTGACLKIDKNTVFNGSSASAANVFLDCSSSAAPSTPRESRWLVTSDGSQRIGGSLPAAPNITLDAADGSITADGDIISGDFLTGNGGRLRAGGAIQLRRDDGNAFITGYNGGLSATDTTYQVSSDGTMTLGGVSPSNPNITLNATGTGEFKGNVVSGNYLDSGAGLGAKLRSGGVVQACRSSTAAVWQGWQLGASSATSEILADGSATFVGTVASGTVSSATSYSRLSPGLIISYRLPSSSASDVFKGGYGSTETSSITAAGAATFAGTVTATVVPPSDARFKENITPANPQLADVVALGGLLKNYDWNDQAPLNEELRSQRQLGLIAQEAAEVCPAIVKDIKRTKQGAVITPEETTPAVYEDKVIPAVYETVVTPAKLGPKGKEIVPASTEEVLVTPERTEQVLVTSEQVIPATYETLDDSYKGISTDALIMKLIGAVAELSAEVTALKSAK